MKTSPKVQFVLRGPAVQVPPRKTYSIGPVTVTGSLVQVGSSALILVLGLTAFIGSLPPGWN